jgi:deoxyribonuclease V
MGDHNGGAWVQVELPTDWPTTQAQAIALQDVLRAEVRQTGLTGLAATGARRIAGLDVAYDTESDLIAAAVVVLDGTTLETLAEASVIATASFPYLPGLLAFREIPALVAALNRVSVDPELLVCDGYGVAHPRRFGLACHLGVLTGLPSIGVAKTPFIGAGNDLANRLDDSRGATVDLVDAGEVVGRALRTRKGVKPVFVSVGHRIDLDTACGYTLRLTTGFRQPETTRRADAASRAALRSTRTVADLAPNGAAQTGP